MRCARYRTALSARLDGEDPGVPASRLDAHVATCDACQGWVRAAGALRATLGEATDAVPARAAVPRPDVMATLMTGGPAPVGRTGLLTLGEWRVVLAVIGALQLVLAWPTEMWHQGHASAHVVHELTTWDVGLAIGYLMLAWMPSRAWGALPVLAVLVTALTGTSLFPLATGHAVPGREVVHVLERAGLGCLWVLARRVPRSSVVLRLA